MKRGITSKGKEYLEAYVLGLFPNFEELRTGEFSENSAIYIEGKH